MALVAPAAASMHYSVHNAFSPPSHDNHKLSDTTIMIRPRSSARLLQTVKSSIQPTRCLSTTASRPREETAEDKASLAVADREPEGSVKTYHPEHQPDYRAHADHGTSLYSPIPRRLQDGSEPGKTVPAAVLSGAPVDLQARTVR